jgi:hypothetical protein
MFFSMGNLLGNCQVGMLFVNFEKPHRLRVQGIASVNDDDFLLKEYAEAQLVVRVMVTEIFRNCPRYVHRYKKIQSSEFVPRSTCETPLAPWKRVDDLQVSRPCELFRQHHVGTITRLPVPAQHGGQSNRGEREPKTGHRLAVDQKGPRPQRPRRLRD